MMKREIKEDDDHDEEEKEDEGVSGAAAIEPPSLVCYSSIALSFFVCSIVKQLSNEKQNGPLNFT